MTTYSSQGCNGFKSVAKEGGDNTKVFLGHWEGKKEFRIEEVAGIRAQEWVSGWCIQGPQNACSLWKVSVRK